jgi:hypothetical protein
MAAIIERRRRDGVAYRAWPNTFPAMSDIDDEAIAAWVRDCQEGGVAAKTITNYHGLLQGAGRTEQPPWISTDAGGR